MARPKTEFTEKQIVQMQEYALEGCQNNTIATLMDIPKTTLIRRFGHLLHKKRCERKLTLRKLQLAQAKNSPAMAIFLGKNELGQTDKQDGGAALPYQLVIRRKAEPAKPKLVDSA